MREKAAALIEHGTDRDFHPQRRGERGQRGAGGGHQPGRNQQMVEIFAAGNDGPYYGTIGSPSSAVSSALGMRKPAASSAVGSVTS